MLELYRALIPANKVINDNHGTNFRVHQNNIEWLSEQYTWIKDGFYLKTVGRGRGAKKVKENYRAPGDFLIPSMDKVKEYLEKKKKETGEEYLKIYCEVWKPRNIRFDPQNYAKTFKAPIDLLVHDEYFPDDSWKYIDMISYYGGGPEVWNRRAFRYENDGLPTDLTPDWWLEQTDDYNDILIRVIIE